MAKKIMTILVLIGFIACAPTMKDLSKLQTKTTDPDPETRIKAVKKIGEIKDPTLETLPVLIDLLKRDPNAGVRAESVNSLGKLGFPEAGESVKHALKTDVDATVRSNAASALYTLIGYKAYDLLKEVLQSDTSSD